MGSDDVIELQFPRPPKYLQVKTRFALPSSPRTVNVWYLWSSLLSSSSDSSALALSLKPYLDSSLDISTWDFWDFCIQTIRSGQRWKLNWAEIARFDIVAEEKLRIVSWRNVNIVPKWKGGILLCDVIFSFRRNVDPKWGKVRRGVYLFIYFCLFSMIFIKQNNNRVFWRCNLFPYFCNWFVKQIIQTSG